MNYEGRWRILTELGSGGQGKVYRVLDKSKFDFDRLLVTIKAAITPTQTREKQLEQFEQFREAIVDLVDMEKPENQGALKVLHLPDAARDASLAKERLAREIKAMQDITHPNLLSIIDADPDSKWFVAEIPS